MLPIFLLVLDILLLGFIGLGYFRARDSALKDFSASEFDLDGPVQPAPADSSTAGAGQNSDPPASAAGPQQGSPSGPEEPAAYHDPYVCETTELPTALDFAWITDAEMNGFLPAGGNG